MSNKKVLISLLAGAAAGAIAGLLLAPDSGKNSRANLKNSASKLGGDLMNKPWAQDLDRIVRDGIAKVQEATSKLNVGEMVASGKKSAEDMLGSFSSEGGKSGGDKGGNGRSGGDQGQGRQGQGQGGAMGGTTMTNGGQSGNTGSDGGSQAGGARSNPGTSPS